MKNKAVALAVLIISLSANSQNFEDIEYLLLASQEDQAIVFKEYLNPLVSSINYGMSSGWSHTAKTHKKLGFDITLSLNISLIPSSSENYSTSEFTSITSSSDFLPTVLGGNTDETISVSLFGQGAIPELTTSFTAPSGIKEDLPLSMIATPSLQLGLGLPYKTDLIIRYIPTRSSKNTSIGLKGVGIKHNILQHFGPVDKIRLIDLSLLVAYSNYSIDYNIQKTSDLAGIGQVATMNLDNYVVKLLASVDLKLLTFYAAAGYSKGLSDLKILGSYDLLYTVADTQEVVVVTVIDPLKVGWNNKSLSANAGLSFNIPGIKFFADYTIQKYNSISFGVSLSIR
jgi:hypothetical protein